MDNSNQPPQPTRPYNPYADLLPDPAPLPKPGHKKRVVIILAAVAVLALCVVAALVFTTKSPSVTGSVVLNYQISGANAAPAIAQVEAFIGDVKAQDFDKAKTLVAAGSPLAIPQFSPYSLQSFAGTDINWESCSNSPATNYSANTVTKGTASYDVINLTFLCQNNAGTKSVKLMFDVRRDIALSANKWQVYYIVNAGDK